MKIASTGDVDRHRAAGSRDHDRRHARPGPSMIPIKLTLNSERGTRKKFTIGDRQRSAVHAAARLRRDPEHADVVRAAERRRPATRSRARRRVKKHGDVDFEDLFTGDQPSVGAAASVVGPAQLAAAECVRGCRIRRTEPRNRGQRTAAQRDARARVDRRRASQSRSDQSTFEVLLRTYRGEEMTKSLPVQIPANARGSVSVMVADGGAPVAVRSARAAGAAAADHRCAADDSRAQQRAQEQPPLRPARHPRRRRRREG